MRWTSVCLCVVMVLQMFLGLLVHRGAGYNLDLDHSLELRGPSGSMFGYSVLLHRNQQSHWLLVGAPLANVSSSPSVRSPGAVYRCNMSGTERTACQPIHTDMVSCGKTCEAESDHQWLGVSLSRQPGDNPHVLACAHRWKNVFYSKKDSQNNKLPNGVCYRYANDLRQAQPIIPCYRDHQRKFGEDYGSCQAGISNFLTEDLMIMGAPGSSYWTGSVLVFNTSSRMMSAYLDDDSGAVQFGSYLGYSVGAGHFLHPGTMEVVGGAPQHRQTGKVFIFTVDANMLRIVSEVSGEQLGSYFGSSVCVVDLNADGLSDLLVGAPMATSVTREEGRVHVFINQGEARLVEAEFQLIGQDSYAARFGETMVNLGDLDDDGYPDVAVGAPQEEDLKGAIYIYNGRKEGVTSRHSQRISGSTLGRDLRMFGQSLSSGIDIDDNGYQDLAVGAFLSDSAVVLRTRPVVRVVASLVLPEQINHRVALCRDQGSPATCINITVCFSVRSRQYRGAIDLQYDLTSDLLHKSSFPHRFYFHGNGSSNSTRGRVRARHDQLTCATHLAYLRREVRDIFTPVQFEVSYALREPNIHRAVSRTFQKPILQQTGEHHNTITNKTRFARSCSLVDCSTDLQLSARLVLPQKQQFFPLGSGRTIMLNVMLLNAGDDAFLPRLALRFPHNIHYIKVLQNEDNVVSCDVTQEVNRTLVGIDCSVSSFLLPAHAQLNVSFLLDVSQNSTPGDIIISVNTSGDNYENEDYLHDNSIGLLLPLRYGIDVNIHGFVTPTSFVFGDGDEDSTPVDCYTERFNYTYKVLNSGPSRSVDTVVEIDLPKILTPYKHRLLQLADWQSSQGVCRLSDSSVAVLEDCEVPTASFIKQLIFFFTSSTTRRMFCSHGDMLCERLLCRLGNLEAGREATIQLEINLNPTVLLQAPGRHGVMLLESTAVLTSPREDPHTILVQRPAAAQVVVEAHFTQKPSAVVKIFIIVISLVLGLLILSAVTYCLWKAGFFKRQFQEKEEFRRDSWDYVPQTDKRESMS